MQHKLLNVTAPLIIAAALLLPSCGPGPEKENKEIAESLRQSLDQQFKDAAAQYHIIMDHLPPDKFPKTWSPETSQYEFSNSSWWCSGFYPGTLVYLFEQTGDSTLLAEVRKRLNWMEIEQYNTHTHDLGFMMMSGFGNAYRVFPNSWYRDILITSAKSLMSRFDPTVGCIKSWDSQNPDDYLVIIDNMMNLELLFWVARETNRKEFYDVAVTHANTTLKNHFRKDNSSYHVLNYNARTGEVKEKKTAQGAADESAWARGQAWGLYGYTMTYRETKDPAYLDQARKIARFILRNPNLPEDKIPYWDFNAPDIPNAERDASAAAIIASALLELCKYVDEGESKEYVANAEIILNSLSHEPYKAAPGTNGGFILQHSVGDKPKNSEVDVPLSYADYYYIEALTRFKNLRE